MRFHVCPHDVALHRARRLEPRPGEVPPFTEATDLARGRVLSDVLTLSDSLREGARLHTLSPATLDSALEALEQPEDEPVDVPEDCNKPCWRHVDGGSQCECDDETEGGVWGPGC